MSENTFYIALGVLLALVGGYRFMKQVTDTNYGTRGSYYNSDADSDFNLLSAGLLIGVIGIICWLGMGGFSQPIGMPASFAAASSAPVYNHGIQRSTSGIVARALLGGRPGFRFFRK